MYIMSDHKKNVRILLPGGGVKGTFQLGFLKAMQDSGKYRIDHVYGTSVGAVLAPFVADGKVDKAVDILMNLRNMNDVAQSWSWNWLNTVVAPVKAIFSLGAYKRFTLVDNALDVLKTERCAFDKCSCVAWDFFNKKEVWFTGPEYPIGMRASSALWLAVPPIKYKDTYLIDGGVTEVLPTSLIKTNDGFEGQFIMLNLSSMEPTPTNKLPSNGMALMYELQWDSAHQLMVRELEDLERKLGDRLSVIQPEKDLFDGALDIDINKMKLAFEMGQRAFERYQRA